MSQAPAPRSERPSSAPGHEPPSAPPGPEPAGPGPRGGDPVGASPPGADASTAAAGRGLDWFNLFVANVQTGFGPFIAVYLSGQRWTQTAIGLALSIGTISSMASQIPAGALVDVMKNKTRIAAFSVLVFTASALMFAIHPIPLFVYLAEILHGVSSCTLGPAIAAMSLMLAGRMAMAHRLGRNARYLAVGNGVGAALMGACGQYLSERAVFYLTAGLTLPALVTLLPLRRFARARTAAAEKPREAPSGLKSLKVLADRRLLIFCGCAMLFTFGNAPLLMLIGGTLTAKGSNPSLLIGACIVLPQIVVALASPAVGRFADRRGRRLVLIVGFAMLPLRALIFATTANPDLVIAVQVLDGIAGAGFGILVPLIVSDVAARSGRFNMAIGAVGFAIGIGSTVSTSAAGWVYDHFGMRFAFYFLAAAGLAAVLLACFAMPETRPVSDD
ncbi:MAG TPA: MFS transporter [Steroidobacteraceae bacterium]|jgi:MFS family permease|nr:MFS transporter [Steroidobacteraceae bacterium]